MATRQHKEELLDTMLNTLAHQKGLTILDYAATKFGPIHGEIFLQYLAIYLLAVPIVANTLDLGPTAQETLEDKGHQLEEMLLAAIKEVETKFKEQNNNELPPKPTTPDPSNN